MISEALLARIDYVDLVDAETLQPIDSVKPNSLLAVAVYFGKTDHPLDAIPIWRYSAHDALQHSSVPAVDKFRKAIEQAEKAKKSP